MNRGTTRNTSLVASMLAMGALWTAPGCDGQTDTDQGGATSVTSDENNALAGTVPAASEKMLTTTGLTPAAPSSFSVHAEN